MKKQLSLILVLILAAAGIFTGCTGKDDSDLRAGDITNGLTPHGAASDDKTSGGTALDVEEDSIANSGDNDGISTQSDIPQLTADAASNYLTGELELAEGIPDLNSGIRYKYIMSEPASYWSTEEYTRIDETGFMHTYNNPLSTFSIDVDTASYTNLRKKLNDGNLPEADAVRIEEMLNYFKYDYEEPAGSQPFRIHTEIGRCPWNEENYLLMIGIQGKTVESYELPKSNLVFLIDVSGSMDSPDKLPLLKNAFSKLVEALGEDDKVSIVVYAGDTGVVLDSVHGNEKETILDAIDNLSPGGSTGGAAGIDLAYRLAEKNFIKGGNNRIILATDGDFNVGPSSVDELEKIIAKKRESGIFLSVMGFGSGNLKDNKMETLADKGNGNYSYIDSTREARKVLVDEMAGTLLTIAKDVKIQIEFNPYHVSSYRLIGYENRALANEDFKDDTVDAGELGAGHSVTALYEIIPGTSAPAAGSDLRYQSGNTEVKSGYKDEISEIRLRYKEPDQQESKEIKQVVYYTNTGAEKGRLSGDFSFAAAAAEFGMLLRNSEYKGNTSVDTILDLAETGLGEDEAGYRLEFMMLVDRYEELTGRLGYGW